ncbi:hypothetical protein GCM10010250_65660 [Streptomyces althioticus]|uniref:Uncharacterized protein n=1 Tax=Streptomyces griseorubens TaxID=66897 RepID=A0ABR4TAA4_9ACTN|nr:hypothetical protein DJ64_00105 [Streptomyces griseorubens]GGQ85340.1 hypothetical protein GCM10010250_65660 [Streptomyces althioticus]
MPYTGLFTAAGFHLVCWLAVLTGLATLHSASRRHQCLQHTAAQLLTGNRMLVPHQTARRTPRPAVPLGIEEPPTALEQPALDTPLELTAEELGAVSLVFRRGWCRT